MNQQESKSGEGAITEATMSPNSMQGGSPKIVHWGNEPRKLLNGLARPHEIFLNVISILLACLLFVYIAFLAAFDGAIVKHVKQQGSFLREMSQLVSVDFPLLEQQSRLTRNARDQPSSRFCSHSSWEGRSGALRTGGSKSERKSGFLIFVTVRPH